MDFAARTAHELYNRWRGFQPWPGAFTVLNGKKLIVHRMAIVHVRATPQDWASPKPGWVLDEDGRMLAACADNTWLEFLEVQLEGKKRLDAAEFLRGNPLARGCATRLNAMSAISPARQAAFEILMAVERGKAHSDELLRKSAVDKLSVCGSQPDHHPGAWRAPLANSA